MVDIDAGIQRLESALNTLKEARALLNGHVNGSRPASKPVMRNRLDRELAEMKRLRAQGLSYEKIGAKVGKHLTTVWSRLNNK